MGNKIDANMTASEESQGGVYGPEKKGWGHP
jgi:hypothetical protein